MAAPRWSYEAPQPWEERQGTLRDRVTRVGVEAQRVVAQQQALLPTLQLDHSVDAAVGDHLQDVGKRILLLQENASTPDKKAQRQEEPRRVVPSRFPEDAGDDDDENQADGAVVQGRIVGVEMMLMDQEWDTRTWNAAKIQVAVETLYEQVEHSDDPRRRKLATTMLIRLLETHEHAVTFVESTIPILMNKSFRSLSKIADMARMFRVCSLLAELSEWFAPILSRDNAMGKSLSFLLRETELCARVVQHHWRGVLFERSLKTREVDVSVRARLRSMHFVKNLELRHQFKVYRDAVGVGGVSFNALHSYIKILYHLVKPKASAVDKYRSHSPIADQKRLLGSGILVILASLIPVDITRVSSHQQDDRRMITELVKRTTIELTRSFSNDADKIASIMRSNIIYRVVCDLSYQLKHFEADLKSTVLIRTSIEVIAVIARAVRQLFNNHCHHQDDQASPSSFAEATFRMNGLQAAATEFLTTQDVVCTLLLLLPHARQRQDSPLCELILSTVHNLACSYGFKTLLGALTRNGGRALEQVILCFDDPSESVVRTAVALYHDMTNHSDARAGFTTAGAVLILSKWCSGGIEESKSKSRFILAICGVALLARQHTTKLPSSEKLLDMLGSLQDRQEALYSILSDLVSGSFKDVKRSALYLHQTTGFFVPILLRFLVQVKPSDMEPVFQTRKQRSISCIVLSRFFKVPSVAMAAFSESTVIHISLALQCSRLDESEGKLRGSQSTRHERYLHSLGLKEGCKALSRLARCPPGSTDISLIPSITSGNVPQLPQAIVCDVVLRLHVLEDIIPLIHLPTDAAEFPDVEASKVHAAIELVGYLRPMPFGESTRLNFLSTMSCHPHGVFANNKLEMLVNTIAPVVLHVLKEKSCGDELVEVCCRALSRLAATNTARNLLLTQGALFIALAHIPEALNASRALQGVALTIDTCVDDGGLFGVPASLFTLMAKLCAIPDGRMAIIKAQVLPRVLKRLQITDIDRPDNDIEVKSEIAVLVQRLAICNTTEGNTSEQFLHFKVIEQLTEITKGHTRLLSLPATPQSPAKRIDTHLSTRRNWRILNNAVGAIAELAQDTLVFVPKIVEVDVLLQLLSIFAIKRENVHSSLQHYVASLHYLIVSITHAIASYPFGKFHEYLLRLELAQDATLELRQIVSFIDQIKKIAFDFTLELNGMSQADSDSRKTIGELAREVVALTNYSSFQPPAARLPPAGSPTPSRLSSPKILENTKMKSLLVRVELDKVLEEQPMSFPPVSLHPQESVQPHQKESWSKGCGIPGPIQLDNQHPVLPKGADLLSTRPPIRSPQKLSENDTLPHYVFARPKSKARRSSTQDRSEQLLMLDPLFQNAVPVESQHRHRQKRSQCQELLNKKSFMYIQEVDHYGHKVDLRARRTRNSYNSDQKLSTMQLQTNDPTRKEFPRP